MSTSANSAADAQRRRAVVAPLLVAGAAIAAIAALLAPESATEAALRAVMFVGTLAAVGTSVFAYAVHDRGGTPAEQLGLRRLILGGAFVAMAASFAGLALQAAALGGTGLSGVGDPTAWNILLHDGSYAAVVVRGLGLSFLVYAAGSRWHAPTATPLVGVGVMLGCAWCVITGHPATHDHHQVTHVVMILHMLAASVWFGGLLALATTMRHRHRAGDLERAAWIVRRFSRAMTVVVATLVAGGLLLTYYFVGSPHKLVHTTYGLVLVAKVTLALAILAVAAFNHRRLVPAVVAGSEGGWRTLARTVATEQVALVAVIGITAVLVNLDPSH